MLVNILIIGLFIAGLIFLIAMFAELYKPVSTALIWLGVVMLVLSFGAVNKFDKQSDATFDEKVRTEVFF